jgi:simple sugar transport system substrate-binding protein
LDRRRSRVSHPGRHRHRLVAALLLATVLALVSGCGGSSVSPKDNLPGGRAIKGKRILFVIYSPPSSPWGQTLSAVKAVETITGIKVQVVYANSDSQLVAVIQTGVAAHVAGMALDVSGPAADSAICAASDSGIPIVAWNTNGYGPAASRCVLAFVGQHFVSAGQSIARYLAKHGAIKQGAQVFCPVEDATGAYAKRRAQGVDSVLASSGARCDVVGVGYGDGENQSVMTRYLQRHPGTNLIVALGGTPLANAPAVLKRLGRHIVVAGFDIADGSTTRIIDGIEHGDIVATVDQQFYSQAFQTVMQLALYLKYGLLPSNIDTSDTSVVDNTNAGLAASLSGTYR